MLPTLRPGQTIVGKRNVRTVHPNDVIVFRHDGLLKIKRVQRIEHGSMYVRGDNPAASTDSRQFGKLPVNVTIATIVWPRSRTINLSISKEQ